MQRLTVDDIQEAIRSAYADVPQEAIDLELRLTANAVRALADGNLVSVERLAESSGMSLEDTSRRWMLLCLTRVKKGC